MAENTRPPVAIRIVRPYDTEEALLEHELETVGKTSVILIGAHPRPTGVILRFEVTLASGTTVLRGEGRVLAHKENAFRGQAGLTLRFTRLDPRSKSVVDRATAMREARASDGPTPSQLPPRPDAAIADALTASTPEPSATAANVPATNASDGAEAGDGATTTQAEQEAAVASARAAAREKANATARTNAKRTALRGGGLTPPPVPASVRPGPTREEATPAPTPVTSIPGVVAEKPTRSEPPRAPSEPPADMALTAIPPRAPPASPVVVPRAAVPAAARPAAGTGPLAPPSDRADLLERLRARAGKLSPERVEEILAARVRA